MIAPGAAIHVFTSAQNSDAGELQMFTAILDDNRAKVVNYSWGDCEANADRRSTRRRWTQVFARAVAQGVNIMVASGDSGSDCEQQTATVDRRLRRPRNPDVVAVGGTTLDQHQRHHLRNRVERQRRRHQHAVRHAGRTRRGSTPPVLQALVSGRRFQRRPELGPADMDPLRSERPGVPPANAAYLVIGGTSIAAPQWSGFLALVGEARCRKGAGIPQSLALRDLGGELPDVLRRRHRGEQRQVFGRSRLGRGHRLREHEGERPSGLSQVALIGSRSLN